MSIGFCTDVVEPNVVSRAFTVIYILLGASCVGGALVLMVQSILEEAAQRSSLRYRQILEMEAFKKEFFRENWGWLANQSVQHKVLIKRGVLSYDDFRKSFAKYGLQFTDEQFKRVCRLYDQNGCGSITYKSFEQLFKGTDKILSAIKDIDASLTSWLFLRIWHTCSHLLFDETNRIYLIFTSYICLGVIWGMTNQKWDLITSTVSKSCFFNTIVLLNLIISFVLCNMSALCCVCSSNWVRFLQYIFLQFPDFYRLTLNSVAWQLLLSMKMEYCLPAQQYFADCIVSLVYPFLRLH